MAIRHVGLLALALLCLAGCMAADDAKNTHVVVLTEATFQDFIEANEFVLAEFYAPWCGHCKNLAPHYEEAAKDLEESGSKIKLASVDCTMHQSVCSQFEVQGYPTLKWFHSGKPVEYNGPRQAAGIVQWVMKKTSPPTKPITTQEEYKEAIAANAVIGFFEKGSDAQKAFIKAAQDEVCEDTPFYEINSEELTTKVEGTFDTVTIYRTFDEDMTLEGELTEETIVAFVSAHGYPYIMEANECYQRYMKRGLEHVFIVVGDNEAEEWEPLISALTTIAKSNSDQIGFATLPKEFYPRVSQFGLSGKKFPAAFVVAPKIEKTYVFPEENDLTSEKVDAFIKDVLAGNIKPNFKSEEAPATNDGPVRIVVGNTFNDEVINNNKDVLIEFYAPWCGHCKQLEPIWDQLGNRVQAAGLGDKVVVAKMDSTLNDNDHVSVRSFPTIKLFRAGRKTEPLDVEAPRTLDGLIAYLNEQAPSLAKEKIPVHKAHRFDDHDEL